MFGFPMKSKYFSLELIKELVVKNSVGWREILLLDVEGLVSINLVL